MSLGSLTSSPSGLLAGRTTATASGKFAGARRATLVLSLPTLPALGPSTGTGGRAGSLLRAATRLPG